MVARRVNVWRDCGYMGADSRGWRCRVFKHRKYPIELRHHYNIDKKESFYRRFNDFKQYIVLSTGEVFIDNLVAAINTIGGSK